jgi:hypothetical protein
MPGFCFNPFQGLTRFEAPCLENLSRALLGVKADLVLECFSHRQLSYAKLFMGEGKPAFSALGHRSPGLCRGSHLE